jgi:Family of unknown function (DUF6328)
MTESERHHSGELSTDEVDDAFRALMEGVRTTIPGVMVLFAFLLILPLQSEFSALSTLDRYVFYLAFASSAVASVLLISPSAHQRARAPRRGIKRRTMDHVIVAAKLAEAGTVAFLVAIGAVVFLVTSIVSGDHLLALFAAVALSAIAGWAWFYLPLVSFRKDASKV